MNAHSLVNLLAKLPPLTFKIGNQAFAAGFCTEHVVGENDDLTNPDAPRETWHHVQSEDLWALLARSAQHARNGAGNEEAADAVMAEIELMGTALQKES